MFLIQWNLTIYPHRKQLFLLTKNHNSRMHFSITIWCHLVQFHIIIIKSFKVTVSIHKLSKKTKQPQITSLWLYKEKNIHTFKLLLLLFKRTSRRPIIFTHARCRFKGFHKHGCWSCDYWPTIYSHIKSTKSPLCSVMCWCHLSSCVFFPHITQHTNKIQYAFKFHVKAISEITLHLHLELQMRGFQQFEAWYD